MTIGEVLGLSADYLAGKGVDSPRLDAELLLGKALGLSRLDLYLHHDRPLEPGERSAARELVRRRGEREPLAYVLGEWGFRRLTLKTDRRALVPRPETESLVERCLELIGSLRAPRLLDVGTGSGAIALALADEHPGSHVTALDSSSDALALARENAAVTGLSIELLEADAIDGLPPGPWDLVVSNPPYVLEGEELPPELGFEPRQAVFSNGHTAAIADHARSVLHGWLVLEVHAERAAEQATLLASLGYAEVRISEDLAGRERVVEGRWATS